MFLRWTLTTDKCTLEAYQVFCQDLSFSENERNHNDTPDDGRLTRAWWSVTCYAGRGSPRRLRVTGKRTPDRRWKSKPVTIFTGRNARKGAAYDRIENERNVADQLVWMPKSNLYKRENPSGCHACNGCRDEKESLQGMQIPCKRRNRISVSDHVWNDPENVFTGWYQSTGSMCNVYAG